MSVAHRTDRSLVHRLLRPFRWLLAPFWLLELFNGGKSFLPNPLLTSVALNRRGLHLLRVALARRMTEWRRRRLESLVPAEDRAAFARDGFVAKDNFLAPEDFAALQAEIKSLVAEARDMKQGHAVTRHIPVTHEVLAAAPHLAKLLDDPRWYGLTRYVASFKSEPIVYLQAIQSHVDQSGYDPQTALHVDAFFPSMKAWFFLDDVAEEDGPFVYVPGSHRLNRRRMAWERAYSIRNAKRGVKGSAYRLTAAEAKRISGAAPQSFAGPGNRLVVGDTVGFHARGESSRPSTRIEIWAYCRPNPFSPFLGFDLYARRPWREWRAEWRWRGIEWIERFGLQEPLNIPESNMWRKAGKVALNTPYKPPK